MPPFTHSDSVVIDATPDDVYDVVSDVTRTGEWSPVCVACWWDNGDEPGPDGPREGAWFTGRNQTPTRTWETHSRVDVADRGREFAWLVAGKYARWGYTITPVDGGVELTESWEFREEGIEFFHEKYAEKAQEQIDNRVESARTGIPATLAAVKAIVESR